MGFEKFTSKIWLSSPTMHGEEQQFVKKAFDSNWVSTVGENLTCLEKDICEFVGCKYAVALSSGTAALHLAVKLAGIKQGDRVFCSDMTFAATVNPVVYEKGVPVFIDEEYNTWNMDPEALKKAFKQYPDTKAVIVANLYGTPAKLDEIQEICNQNDAILIEDAAESLGATFRGIQTGTFGKYNAISFNGNKIITTGGGGAITAKEEEAAIHMQYISTQAKDDPHYYIHHEIGFNYRMTNLQAALGVAQMEELPEFIRRKNKNYQLYLEQLNDFPFGRLLGFREGTESNRWFYSLELQIEKLRGSLREIISSLQARGIQTRAIWDLIHKQLPYREKTTYQIERALYYSSCILNLPCSTQLTKEEIVFVVEQIKTIVGEMADGIKIT